MKKSNTMIEVHAEKCDTCGTCSAICPVDAIIVSDGSITIEQTICIKCAMCEKICPVGALKLINKP